MYSKISFKRIVCFLLALVMLLVFVGCGEEEATKKKKKVIVKKKVVVVEDEQQNDFVDQNVNVDNNNSNLGGSSTASNRPLRDLPNVEKEGVEVETYDPEFDYEYADWSGPEGYVIIYSPSTSINRVSANNLKQYFIDNYGVTLEVKKDTEVAATDKEILVGNTNRYTSKLDENEFATKLVGNKLVFEGGHYAMVEKAADWFMSVKVKSGKVAILSGTAEDFTSTVTVNGKTYSYVWGDEFDGVGGIDRSRWNEDAMKNFYGDIKMVAFDLDFNRVEDGRLKMFANRYYDETDGAIEYGTGGVLNTRHDMVYTRGYAVIRAKIPYQRGAFPAWWTNSSDSSLYQKEYSDKIIYYFEIDILEAFSGNDGSIYNTIHKWYKYSDTTNKRVYADAAKTIDITDQVNYTQIQGSIISTITNYVDNLYNSGYKNALRETRVDTDEEYHDYSLLWEDDHLYFGIDGEWYSDYPIDVAFDGYSGNDNNGYGFDMLQYMCLDDHILSPNATSAGYKTNQIVINEDLPISLYADYIRIYQDPTDSVSRIIDANVIE